MTTDGLKFTEIIKYYMAHPYENFDYATYVDKHKAKDFVRGVIGVIKEYAYFTTPGEVDNYDFSSLPQRFVIKGTHGWGYNIFVDNNFDKDEAVLKMKYWLSHQFNIDTEKQYAQVTPGVIIEEYLPTNTDYKFYFMGGRLALILLCVDRHGDHRRNFYDENWNLLQTTKGTPPNTDNKYPKPSNFEEVVETAYKLLKKIGTPPFVRIDLYNIEGDLYFGEYTFTPSAGGEPFDDEEDEIKYGNMINNIK